MSLARRTLIVIGLLAVAGPVAADLGGYVIRDYRVELDVRADARVLVSERIEVEFSEPRHGIYRTIPVRYTDPRGYEHGLGFRLLQVTDGAGKAYGTKVDHAGRYVKIRIGSPSFRVRGTVVYVLRYRVDDALVHFAEHDELYWNVTGTEWRAPIERASATVRLPGEVADEDLRLVAYTGRFGSREQAATIERIGPDAVSFTARRSLQPLEGLTVAVGWPHGLVDFPGPLTRSWRFFAANWVLLSPLVALVWLWRRWRRRGSDPAGRGSVVVRYEPPPDVRPAELGTIVDERVDLRDITAAIVDLAVRGHLRIEVVRDERFFGLLSSEKIVFHRLQPDDGQSLLPYEQTILSALFFDGRERVESGDLDERFYVHVPQIRRAIYERLAATGHFVGNPDTVRKRFRWFGALAGVLVFGAGALWADVRGGVMPNALIVPGLAGAATALLFLAFASAMPKRTRKGVDLRSWALGFEEFVDRVEGPRLEADRQRDVFESLLPYAMALGLAAKWARRFEGIYAAGEAPGWYVGPGSPDAGFSTRSFQRSLSATMAEAGRSLTSVPRSRGSSGFGGGGGFSGGGGGGGGGGSW